MTQLSGALVAWALIVASGYGGGPPASANVVSKSGVIGQVGRRIHPTVTWFLADSSRLAFFWAPHARRYDVFHLGGGYAAVGGVDPCEALFAGRLLEYDTWRYTRATSADTVYVARVLVSSLMARAAHARPPQAMQSACCERGSREADPASRG